MSKVATKAEERKALEQIKAIVESLGSGSYIATAFDGCFEYALQNIEMDAAFSMKDRAEQAEDTLRCRENELADKEKEIKELRKQTQSMTAGFQDDLAKHQQLMKDFEEMRLAKFEAENELGCLQNKMIEMENQVMRLKARLFDLLDK